MSDYIISDLLLKKASTQGLSSFDRDSILARPVEKTTSTIFSCPFCVMGPNTLCRDGTPNTKALGDAPLCRAWVPMTVKSMPHLTGYCMAIAGE